MSTGNAVAGRSWQRQLNDWLANPLLVAVVGSLLVYVLIPQLTRGWQDHAKVLEVKTGLVTDMSEAVGDAAMSGRFIASGLIGRATTDPKATQRAFNDAYRDWSVKSAVIGSQLAAYFPHDDLGARWRAYADVVADYLQLGARGTRDDRATQLLQIARYFPPLRKRARSWWQSLLDRDGADGFQTTYAALAGVILGERDRLVQQVLDARATGF